MTKQNSDKKRRLYLGVDVGGTKVHAALVRESGEILAREKSPTPRRGGPERVVAALEKCIDDLLARGGVAIKDIAAVGIAVPGVVDVKRGLVVVAPNMKLSGVDLGALVTARYKLPVVIGNDGNFGALGESWLGSARRASSAVYICVGTGIGAGLVLRGKLWRGCRDSAGEIGHLLMQIGGPKCGCGGTGCFEALASRSAIERQLREAVAGGRKSLLVELCGGDLSVIRSGMLRKALAAEDELTVEVVRRAAEVLGMACVNIRHLIDPEAIVLGGGVIEAGSDFIMPIVENVVGLDPLPGAGEGGRVLLAALGDDAVALGAVAAARRLVGRSPFKKRYAVAPRMPKIALRRGKIAVGRKTFRRGACVLVSGRAVKPGKKFLARCREALGQKDLAELCRGGPEVLFVGAGKSGRLELDPQSQNYLDQRAVRAEILPLEKAVAAYNRSKLRKAAILLLDGK